MKKSKLRGFDLYLHEELKDPEFAALYAEELATRPLAIQLAIMRRRKWLTQKAVARKLKVKQPHVARTESGKHDPRLSSIVREARALGCQVMLVPDKFLPYVARLVAGHRPKIV